MKTLYHIYKGMALFSVILFIACTQPEQRVCTSMWLRVTTDDSLRVGFRRIEAEGQIRHIVPITEWTATPDIDTYHQLHHHGVALESEQMAYRIYFDKKHTVDVYAKRTPRLELPTSYWYPSDGQLRDHYGDDVLRVSGTVGVGSVKPWNGNKMIHFDSVATRTQRIVESTADKAVVEISVTDWHNQQQIIDTLAVRYTLLSGHRDMMCEVFASDTVDNLCTGVQYILDDPDKLAIIDETEQGVLLGTWGTGFPVNDTIKYAKQTVGLAVFIPREYAQQTLTGDKRNLLCLFSRSNYLRFYLTVVALMEDNPPAHNADEFLQYMLRWRDSLVYKET